MSNNPSHPPENKAQSQAANLAPAPPENRPAPPPVGPAEPLLPAEDRARIDYEHRKKLREILLEKGILAFIFVILGWIVSSSLANNQLELSKILEQHRSALQAQQSELQTRREALKHIVQSYNKLFDTFIMHAGAEEVRKLERLSDDDRTAYRKLITKIANEVNEYELLLPSPFPLEVEKYLFLHRGLLYKKLTPYRPFMRFVTDQLTDKARSYYMESRPATKAQFELEPAPSSSDRNDELAGKYLDLHYEKWRASKQP
jgi:hypothetical protein